MLLNECLNEHERAQNKKLTCLALFTASYLPPPRSAVDVRPVNIRERDTVSDLLFVYAGVCVLVRLSASLYAALFACHCLLSSTS